MQPTIKTLHNGLRVVIQDTKSFPSFTALLLVGAGSRFETESNNGIAHFFEHMAFKGSKNYPDSLTISSTIEGLGGVFNAFTDKDHTGYWIKAPVRHVERVLDVVSEMILSPTLDPEEIEREKGVIIEEMNMYEDMPSRKVGDLFEELLYAGSPLGYDIIGTKETVTSATRQTFLDYFAERYVPTNAVLVLAGGFEGQFREEDLIALAEQKFGHWQQGTASDVVTVTDMQEKPRKNIQYKKTEQAHFCVGFRTFPFHDKRRYALSVLSTILGGGMSSRLFINVRERRGLCYYISTGREFYTDVGNIVTQAGVAIQKEKVQEALNVTLEQYSTMKTGDITSQEMQRAKEMMKGRMVLSLEDSHSVASFFGSRLLLENEIIMPAEVTRRIDAVTIDDVVAVATDCFRPERLNFTIIGPFEKNDIQLEYNK